MLAVVREALSSAARHAHATAVEVTVGVTAGTPRLRVADNGRGIGPGAARHSGLGNLRIRDQNLGGACALTADAPSGTVLKWTVPLRPADPA
ncbi:sensor histidine kinase [Streptomyces sp. NPDC060027]|uniref:sensor histidine kinase n=1 Tax=Streptomyces sp. NPDC060027 TaxID=3347040 RepID=UPI00368FEF33